MLEELYIKDFALIREATISFGPGLNIITGETGAGKSILLGALAMVLGNKATTGLIRSGAARSTVVATFSMSSVNRSAILEVLEEAGIDEDEDAQLVLKREITAEGKGRSYINSQPVPSATLKKIGHYLVDIHGQNEHQNILNLAVHRNILDRYARLQALGEKVKELYEQKAGLEQKLRSVSLSESEKVRRVEILRHEITELESAAINDPGELEDLASQEKVLANAESILRDLSLAYEILSGEEGVLQKLSLAARSLDHAANFQEDLTGTIATFREGSICLEEASRSLRSARDRIDLDPERLQTVRDRMDLLQGLIRKYGGSLDELKNRLENARRELEGIELSRDQEDRMRSEIAQIRKGLIAAALDLSVSRRKAAEELESRTEEELSYLQMADTRLRISVKWQMDPDGEVTGDDGQTYSAGAHGLDIVEFLMAASEKDILRPLRKIASGGEMSRIMLAIKKVIIDSDPVATMIFDEVDAGVGGRAADAVGEKLHELADSAQVIVITHLHQIAGKPGATHYKVAKDKEEGTRIFRLNADQRLQEVARMIGGREISESALTHARSLLSGGA